MTALDDEGRPRQGGQSSSSFRVQSNPPKPFHAVVRAELVMARSGRARYLLTYRCVCGHKHLATARTVVDTARRTTACGLPVILHAAAGEAAA